MEFVCMAKQFTGEKNTIPRKRTHTGIGTLSHGKCACKQMGRNCLYSKITQKDEGTRARALTTNVFNRNVHVSKQQDAPWFVIDSVCCCSSSHSSSFSNVLFRRRRSLSLFFFHHFFSSPFIHSFTRRHTRSFTPCLNIIYLHIAFGLAFFSF